MNDLNKPAIRATPMAWDESSRPPRWYLWDGGFLLLGQGGGAVSEHGHHAIQVTIAFGAGFRVCDHTGAVYEGRGLIVRPDVLHAFDALGGAGAMLFVDPESTEGAWLASALTEDVTTIPEGRLQSCIERLRTLWERPLESLEVADLVRHCMLALCPGALPTRKADARVARILRHIRESADLRISLEAAAEVVHLSPGRFAHLFTDELGLPFRRYMLWRKVTRAMLAMGRERTLAAAAQHGDFADAAHLTRTFVQMFGMKPSVLMRGDFFEIASPFTAA